jgi:hypothetical protein
MDWISALAGVVAGAVVGAFAKSFAEALVPQNLFDRVAKKPSPFNNIQTKWNSCWGPDQEHVEAESETIEITKQRGSRIWGKATQSVVGKPERVWEIEGRFIDGRHLQLMYYPSATSARPDFSDYGCYLFVKQGNGDFEGMAVGEGPEPTGGDTIRADVCRMTRMN